MNQTKLELELIAVLLVQSTVPITSAAAKCEIVNYFRAGLPLPWID
ncbi:MAG TPA: hypothetical protein VEL11_12785 [Candidatus Bathyarchaeia archaeon]|nr:hypothetical protein [Candidatus Bathyarchaeia archaeon]